MTVRTAQLTSGGNWVHSTRRRWGLSQAQFATLFARSVRTVRRWESGQFAPREHQLWILNLLVEYTRVHHTNRFRHRFVRQRGRLSKPGRPHQ